MHLGTKRRISWENSDNSCELFEAKPRLQAVQIKTINRSPFWTTGCLSLRASFCRCRSELPLLRQRHPGMLTLGSFCKLRQISWPESTVDQQQDQQREECGFRSPGDKHLRLAPSPSCIWWTTSFRSMNIWIYDKHKRVLSQKIMIMIFITWSAQAHRFPQGWLCGEEWGEGRSKPGCSPRPCSRRWTCGTHGRHSQDRCKEEII